MTVIVRQTELNSLPLKTSAVKRYGVISDVHLGHVRTPTDKIVDTLFKYIVTPKMMYDLDALFISGDLFDRLLTLPIKDNVFINEFISKLLKYSAKFKTPIRILEGTPSHDWKQSRQIDEFNKLYDINADVQYISDLAIVEDESLNMTIGYVPDEYGTGCETTTDEFKELMASRGYDKLDLIVMHGMFFFQVPEAGRNTRTQFDHEQWVSLSDLIVIGHDHKHKHFKNIIIPSSIERLAHNEEEHKGFLIIDKVGNVSDVYHVINKEAMIYKTIGTVNDSDLKIIEAVDAQMTLFAKMDSPLGRINIKYNSEYDMSVKIKEWNNTFTDVVVAGEAIKDVKDKESIEEIEWTNDMVNITDDNIIELLLPEVKGELCHEAIKSEALFIQSLIR